MTDNTDPTETKVNKKLLREVMAHIESLPKFDYKTPAAQQGDTWCQGGWGRSYSCGTAACFAGWTVMIGNPDNDFRFDGQYINSNKNEDLHHRFIEDHAKDMLGLGDWEADELFNPGNTIGYLRELVDEYTL